MKKRISSYLLLIMCLVSILTISCEKVDDIGDIDGNVYKTVKIGHLVWMAENLKTTRYRNGDLIETTNPSTLDIIKESAPKYQWSYDSDENNVNTYGRLYTWYAATDNRGLCPTGWHLPDDKEWTELESFLDEKNWNQAGGMMKEKGITHWQSPNEGATNESGFTGLPGGTRTNTGEFLYLLSRGYWWGSYTGGQVAQAYSTGLLYDRADMGYFEMQKNYGRSVRCVKDN
jgi:uncharacterized protein (TIGR02145 family)